jgi:long-chain fatty acid transport protein
LPLTAPGTNHTIDSTTNQEIGVQQLPAPYRYMQTDNQATIIFPTASVGWEVVRHLRVGAGFISGIAVITVDTAGGTANQNAEAEVGDHMTDDGFAHLQTKDMFVPGFVASAHWSVLPQLDVSVWGRWMDSVRTSSADFMLTSQIFDKAGRQQPICADLTNVNCNQAYPNHYVGPTNALTSFKYTIPPEFRLGVRFHQPRTKSTIAWDSGREIRDPLHDDSYDVELDGSYTMNSMASNIETRFKEKDGAGAIPVIPTGVPLPPNADRPTGFKDSYGLRIGGQWNALPDKLAIRAGGWFESQSVDPAYATIFPVGATRWGFGGGIVLRQDFIDFSIGYQRHLSAGQNNNGDGKMLIAVGTGYDVPPFNTGNPAPNQFRSKHAVNGGHFTESAHAFTLGGTVHF